MVKLTQAASQRRNQRSSALAQMTARLSIESAEIKRGGVVLAKNINLELRAGDHVVIVGESGGGKSTLLSHIADSHIGELGQGVDANALNPCLLVLQQGALLEARNVINNVRLVDRYSAITSDSSVAEQALKDMNIDADLWTSKIATLSGGQQRRVAIARALAKQPGVVLFDEPDAGLDLKNLQKLAATLNQLRQTGCSLITVSHNPFFIARVADRVFRLEVDGLHLMHEWEAVASSEAQAQDRQMQMQQELLEERIEQRPIQGQRRSNFGLPILRWLAASFIAFASLIHWPKSIVEPVKTASYCVYIALITGVLFYGLVGLMLGATLIAVVELLAENGLTGLMSYFVEPEMLVEKMGGRFALYLGPPIGAILFAARSGGLISNWFGEMVRSKQVYALELLKVPTAQLLTAPGVIAVFVSALASIIGFTLALWWGGTLMAEQIFRLNNAQELFALNQYHIASSDYWLKTTIYSGIIALSSVGLGMAKKDTANEVNLDTTRAIIFATLSIALTELLLVMR